MFDSIFPKDSKKNNNDDIEFININEEFEDDDFDFNETKPLHSFYVQMLKDIIERPEDFLALSDNDFAPLANTFGFSKDMSPSEMKCLAYLILNRDAYRALDEPVDLSDMNNSKLCEYADHLLNTYSNLIPDDPSLDSSETSVMDTLLSYLLKALLLYEKVISKGDSVTLDGVYLQLKSAMEHDINIVEGIKNDTDQFLILSYLDMYDSTLSDFRISTYKEDTNKILMSKLAIFITNLIYPYGEPISSTPSESKITEEALGVEITGEDSWYDEYDTASEDSETPIDYQAVLKWAKKVNATKESAESATEAGEPENKLHQEFFKRFASPKAIKKELDNYVYKQDKAKELASIVLFNQLHGRKTCALTIGPSGCGKTEIYRQLRKLYKNIVIFDVSRITNDGWSGSQKVFSIFDSAAMMGLTKDEIENAIYILDEFDKLVTPKYASGGDNVSESLQAELLTIIEGTTIQYSSKGHMDALTADGGESGDGNSYTPMISLDTSKMSFVCCGAFSSLYEKKRNAKKKKVGFIDSGVGDDEDITMMDVIGYGVLPELAGRLSRIVTLDPILKPDIQSMLTSKKDYNPLVQVGKAYDCKISADNKWIEQVSEEFYKTEFGVRNIIGMIQDEYNSVVYNTGKYPQKLRLKVKEDDSR